MPNPDQGLNALKAEFEAFKLSTNSRLAELEGIPEEPIVDETITPEVIDAMIIPSLLPKIGKDGCLCGNTHKRNK